MHRPGFEPGLLLDSRYRSLGAWESNVVTTRPSELYYNDSPLQKSSTLLLSSTVYLHKTLERLPRRLLKRLIKRLLILLSNYKGHKRGPLKLT